MLNKKLVMLSFLLLLQLFTISNLDAGVGNLSYNRYFAGEYSSYYCHFNIPFYMSYLGDKEKSTSIFYSGFASQIGQFQYTRKINDTSKWGWGWSLPLLTLYAEKEWSIVDTKKINTSLMLGVWPVSINTKVFIPLDQKGRLLQGSSVNYYFHGGSTMTDAIWFLSPYYPRSNIVSLNYEGLLKVNKRGRFNLIYSLGVNYLYLAYKVVNKDSSPSAKFLYKSDPDSQWEKRLAWNASIGINFK